jgi:hypothetical protein
MRKSTNSVGRLAQSAIHDSLIDQTLEFIWDSLLPWKDDPDRPFAEAEEELNAQLHNFLQSRASEEFPMVFFQTEQRQEGRRRVDLSAKPTHAVTIQGVIYNRYRPLLVIEGKRLPAPSRKREREYVSGGTALSGGIQRFKWGLHGKDHSTALIVGYIQKGDARQWHSRINDWITELAASHATEWSGAEILKELDAANANDRARYSSTHPRVQNCKPAIIHLSHFWLKCADVNPALAGK